MIVLTYPEGDWVQVAPISHRHPDNPPQQATSMYNLPTDPNRGEGTVDVGWPKFIHCTHLVEIRTPISMGISDFQALLAEIREFW